MPTSGDDSEGTDPYGDLMSSKGPDVNNLLPPLSLHKPAARRLGWASAVFALSGLVHLGVLLVSGGPWEGAVSYRKPLTFGISFAALLWTLGWIIDRLPARPRLETVLATTLIGSSVLEVGLITMQAWRGVASHFNEATGGDTLVWAVMGISIGVMSVAFLGLAVWAVIERPQDPATRLAVLAGLAIFFTGLGLGQWVVSLGVAYFGANDLVPDTVVTGGAGVVKFPHATAMHGLQVFIGAAILSGSGSLDARRRLGVVRMVVAGYTLFVLWSIVHTMAGRAPTDLAGIELAMAAAACGLLGVAAARVVSAWRSHPVAAAGVGVTLR